MTMKIDHIAFQVSDLDASIQFYKTVLGLKLLSKTVDEEHGEAFAFLELEGGNLELLQLLDQTESHRKSEIKPPFCPHLAIRTENLERLVSALREESVPIVKGPLEIPGMVKWFYIADPDHNIVEFVQWLTRS